MSGGARDPWCRDVLRRAARGELRGTRAARPVLARVAVRPPVREGDDVRALREVAVVPGPDGVAALAEALAGALAAGRRWRRCR